MVLSRRKEFLHIAFPDAVERTLDLGAGWEQISKSPNSRGAAINLCAGFEYADYLLACLWRSSNSTG